MQLRVNSRTLELDHKFDEQLEKRWLEAECRNVIRFKFSECVKKRVLDGRYAFHCYLNVNRLTMKRKAQNMDSIKVKVNKSEFNFTKINKDEILFDFDIEEISNTLSGAHRDKIKATIIVNNAPIEHCSSLLVLELDKCLPQVFTKESLLLALYVASCSKNLDLRLGFNSAGANSSVNHSHWHLYYQKDLLIAKLPIVDNQLVNWFLKSLAFELDINDQNKPDNYLNLANQVEQIINYITEDLHLAYNLFVTKCSTNSSIVRLFIWPRLPYFGSKDDNKLMPALCEFSGFFICKTEQLFNELTEEKLIAICKEYEIDENSFEKILKFKSKLIATE